ncbi:izumo sperm-egg fusion protein 2 isoform X2 [Dermochelys coriacea]|uniref:izumo sperm-egg fusion protein 2 isoform X2 n=1 Tax=Dermochelys coriacea TaxID=27794 RepID=UPI001CA9D961|nr:izumo sperm-egg fusion protein 2 isoform X2 [Dermochelys coriacea]
MQLDYCIFGSIQAQAPRQLGAPPRRVGEGKKTGPPPRPLHMSPGAAGPAAKELLSCPGLGGGVPGRWTRPLLRQPTNGRGVGTHRSHGIALSSINALIHRVRLTAAGLERSALTDQALLDALVAYRRRTTMELKSALKEHQAKACNPKTCVDSQARLSLRYRPPAPGPPIARTGVSVVLCMGALLFLALSVAAVTYWRNQQSLRQ